MKKPSPYLTFAGTIPFIAGAILLIMGVDAVRVFGKTEHILAVYGLVIATFMAGAQWGNHLSLTDDNRWAVRLPIASNVVALILWLGFLTLSAVGFMALLIFAFISLLMVDYGLYQAQIISPDYFTVRKYVTAIVVVALIVAVWQM
ncbi:DUF3429 domain-containing protein [Psychrobacter sp. TAE2020]|uniref:DUF3429 domain-containing protein n=1 Tax=Psychrobacter sp. TAE2020 TaxID=2846762 RepID=UPI001C122ABE|nr:DUF3429 domain-containing protein [Psychrobacter sp. TAE2020]MBU5615711.1 DUF3429 domain-containing protein [Psychrobacter sp. TAE2020]